MTEMCGSCVHYTPDPAPAERGPNETMSGFGKCEEICREERSNARRVSAWPWGCNFTPSRYEGPDKDPPALLWWGVDMARQPSDDGPAAKDDRPPLELT